MLGAREVDDLRWCQTELAAAVAELATAGGKQWHAAPDDPVVLSLRALAKVSIECPNATSTEAAKLLAQFTAASPRV